MKSILRSFTAANTKHQVSPAAMLSQNAFSEQDNNSLFFSFVFIISVVVVLLLSPLGGCGLIAMQEHMVEPP